MTAQDDLNTIAAILDTIADAPNQAVTSCTPSDYVHIGQAIARDRVRDRMTQNEGQGPDKARSSVLRFVRNLPTTPADRWGMPKHIGVYNPSDFVDSGKAAVRESILDALGFNKAARS